MESRYKKVLVVDFGGQYTHQIARRVRELKVYSEIISPEDFEKELKKMDIAGAILSGGPKSVLDEDLENVKKVLESTEKPVLGICYGHQLLAKAFGGLVEKNVVREYGRTRIKIVYRDKLLTDLPEEFWAWMSHWDTVTKPPKSWIVTSISESGAIASMTDNHRIYSTQFHPEVTHTEHGLKILENFLRKICYVEPWWDPGDVVEKIVEDIRNMVGPGENVVCAVSGGVDSTTTAVITHKAIGDRLYCIFIDTGLMRKDEREEVVETLKHVGIKNLIVIDASKRFLEKLRRITDPEIKRRIIGEEFIRIFEEEALKIPNVKWLAQGTIYPDRIESGRVGAKSSLIKSHHNVGGLPDKMNLKLIEPLKDFYKDEVRMIARKLGLPKNIWTRHPFPGPGLAVRIIGEINEEKLRICREASAIIEEELKRAGLYEEVWQAFAVVGDDKWVGVMGDTRKEGYIVTVRIVQSIDGMTADWYKINYELLDKISRRIINEVENVTMVTYAVTSKPPSTIEPC
ncbi:MAG: glutamine-hydrolyzing GMP synthase [Nitrososphaerota archaeon]|nr:glutamine-hydrolyzing GMP synthase [Candidatus Geocrenenecus dongiae]